MEAILDELVLEAKISLGSTSSSAKKFVDDFLEITDPHPWDRNSRLLEGTMVQLVPLGKSIHISDIQSTAPSSGAGTRAMKTLMRLADKHRVELVAFAQAYADDPRFITSTDRLVQWYLKLGFEIVGDRGDDGYDITYRPR